MVVIIEHHMAHVTRPNTNTTILVWMVVTNTNMPSLVWMVMVVIIKHHISHAKTQYQYVDFSMDGDGGHHLTSYGPCHDPIPIYQM